LQKTGLPTSRPADRRDFYRLGVHGKEGSSDQLLIFRSRG
jgi:hypothetical protein